MKKKLLSALTMAITVGVASTTFAAANPFSDVPAGHWAYDAVTQLASEGVVDGYGDGTYLGNRNITRYEMAQMVARAMAKVQSGVKVTSTGDANLKSLMAEFKNELDNLGIRVSELEKYADKVQWSGKIEYTYESNRTDPDKTNRKTKENADYYLFRLEPRAEINNHWTANARIDAYVDTKKDTSTDMHLVRGYAEGDYRNFNIKLGKQELYTNENGLLFDTEFTGAALTFGNKLTATLMAGRMEDNKVEAGGANTDPSSMQGINIQYTPDRGLYAGAAYYNIDDSDLKTVDYSKDGKEDRAGIWSANAGYKFGSKTNLWGSYAKNSKADYEDYSWQAELDFGDYNWSGGSQKGAWGFWAGYRRQGANVSFAPTAEDVLRGTKGWFVGAAYAPMKNVGLIAKYFNGEYVTGGGDAEKLFGRVEFFF